MSEFKDKVYLIQEFNSVKKFKIQSDSKTPHMIIIISGDGKILLTNRACLENALEHFEIISKQFLQEGCNIEISYELGDKIDDTNTLWGKCIML
jgi:hypothetical protein